MTTLCIYSRAGYLLHNIHILRKEKNIFTEEIATFKHKYKALHDIFTTFGELQHEIMTRPVMLISR